MASVSTKFDKILPRRTCWLALDHQRTEHVSILFRFFLFVLFSNRLALLGPRVCLLFINSNIFVCTAMGPPYLSVAPPLLKFVFGLQPVWSQDKKYFFLQWVLIAVTHAAPNWCGRSISSSWTSFRGIRHQKQSKFECTTNLLIGVLWAGQLDSYSEEWPFIINS